MMFPGINYHLLSFTIIGLASYADKQHHQQPPNSQQPPAATGQNQQQNPHHHDHVHGHKDVLHTENILEEKEHIAEHMEVPVDTSNMSQEELQFHYFKMHDNDKNNKLDGTEIINSLIHWHIERHHQKLGDDAHEPKVYTDEEFANLIDPLIAHDDTNEDGYIDYAEYIEAQKTRFK